MKRETQGVKEEMMGEMVADFPKHTATWLSEGAMNDLADTLIRKGWRKVK